MVDLEGYLYDRIKPIITMWEEEGIYAISFFIYSNEAYEFDGVSNVSQLEIGYNTESDCPKAKPYSEERWNFAFWRQDMTPIVSAEDDDEGMKTLFQWYSENGIEGIGDEDQSSMYDKEYRYVGKGPNGYFELLMAASNVARRLQLEGFIKDRFGSIPIIVHELEYPWFVEKATENANPNGEAQAFLKWIPR